MRRRGLLLMLAGLIAAVAAGIMIFSLSQSITPPRGTGTPQAAAPTATPFPSQIVVLAGRDLPLHTVIAPADVVTREFPVGLVPADAFSSPTQVLSQTATTQVFAGEVLLRRQFVAAGGNATASASLPAGKVLVPFPADDMLNSTGAVQPGDHVDILVSLPVSGTTTLPSNNSAPQEAAGSRPLVTQATMQNIEVYSTGLWQQRQTAAAPGAAGNAQGIKVVTFIVDHQEALILKYIKDSGGTIDLVVRSINDKDNVATDPVSLEYLVDLYHFVNLSR
jgi:pilus assembly protein CpaB